MLETPFSAYSEWLRLVLGKARTGLPISHQRAVIVAVNCLALRVFNSGDDQADPHRNRLSHTFTIILWGVGLTKRKYLITQRRAACQEAGSLQNAHHSFLVHE